MITIDATKPIWKVVGWKSAGVAVTVYLNAADRVDAVDDAEKVAGIVRIASAEKLVDAVEVEVKIKPREGAGDVDCG